MRKNREGLENAGRQSLWRNVWGTGEESSKSGRPQDWQISDTHCHRAHTFCFKTHKQKHKVQRGHQDLCKLLSVEISGQFQKILLLENKHRIKKLLIRALAKMGVGLAQNGGLTPARIDFSLDNNTRHEVVCYISYDAFQLLRRNKQC